jgi:glutathione-independent formaldehyde dehydrogenase
MSYNCQLMQAILYDKIDITKAVNVETTTLDEAPKGYAEFDSVVAKKFVVNPHNLIPNAKQQAKKETTAA